MRNFSVRFVVLTACILPVAGCYTRVESPPSTPLPNAVVISPALPTVITPGTTVVKPY